jgi:hypothetical protein
MIWYEGVESPIGGATPRPAEGASGIVFWRDRQRRAMAQIRTPGGGATGR